MTSKKTDLMRKESTDLPACQPLLVSIQLILTFTEEKFTIGVDVVTHKTVLSVMGNASGSWQDVARWHLTLLNQDITNYATVKCHRMHHSAMELISFYWDGYINIIEDFGACGVLHHSGDASDIGCSLSTNE